MSAQQLRVGAWQRACAPAWVLTAEDPCSARSRYAENMSRAVQSLVAGYVRTEREAAGVIMQLLPSLTHCDSLSFDLWEEGIAYLIWHFVDRYHRIQHVLDLLMAEGHLPIRHEQVTMLEVGSGPAPATFAVADYYASFDTWCRENAQPYAPGAVFPATLDQGPIWGRLIHHLSEGTLRPGVDQRPHRIFGTDYVDLRTYSPWTVHNAWQEALGREIQSEWDADGIWVSVAAARREAWTFRGGPPSKFDLIVIANFLTNEEMTENFADKIDELASSLTPGGILVFLGGIGEPYPRIWDRVDHCRHVARLKPVLDVRASAHSNEETARLRVATATVTALQRLRDLAPLDFADVSNLLPRDVVTEEAGQIVFPSYRIKAFKREGPKNFSTRELRRGRLRQRETRLTSHDDHPLIE